MVSVIIPGYNIIVFSPINCLEACLTFFPLTSLWSSSYFCGGMTSRLEARVLLLPPTKVDESTQNKSQKMQVLGICSISGAMVSSVATKVSMFVPVTKFRSELAYSCSSAILWDPNMHEIAIYHVCLSRKIAPCNHSELKWLIILHSSPSFAISY